VTDGFYINAYTGTFLSICIMHAHGVFIPSIGYKEAQKTKPL